MNHSVSGELRKQGNKGIREQKAEVEEKNDTGETG